MLILTYCLSIAHNFFLYCFLIISHITYRKDGIETGPRLLAAALVVNECPQDVNAANNESNNENNSDLKKENKYHNKANKLPIGIA